VQFLNQKYKALRVSATTTRFSGKSCRKNQNERYLICILLHSAFPEHAHS